MSSIKELIQAIKDGTDYTEKFNDIWGDMVATKIADIKSDLTKNLFSEESIEEGIGRGDRYSALSNNFRGAYSRGKEWDEDAPKYYKKSTPKKIYHDVKFSDKDKAKAEGMRFDGETKKWYHTDSEKSSKSSFPKLQLKESETLDEELSEEVSPEEAHRFLTANGMGNKDYHEGSSDYKERLIAMAKKHKYKKSATSPGSLTRAFHAHLTKQAKKYLKDAEAN